MKFLYRDEDEACLKWGEILFLWGHSALLCFPFSPCQFPSRSLHSKSQRPACKAAKSPHAPPPAQSWRTSLFVEKMNSISHGAHGSKPRAIFPYKLGGSYTHIWKTEYPLWQKRKGGKVDFRQLFGDRGREEWPSWREDAHALPITTRLYSAYSESYHRTALIRRRRIKSAE